MYHSAMRVSDGGRAKRRSIDRPRATVTLRVQVDVETAERLAELSNRYSVARGTIARAAVEAGLKAAHERLRRAARRGAQKMANPRTVG